MKSFKYHIKSIKQEDWDYYYEISNRKLKHPFNSRRSHKQFIKNYFYRAGKEQVFEFIKFLPNEKLNNDRLKHTSSIFFLGVLLKTKTSIHDRVLTDINKPGYGEFPFIWFLTCLFHDFAFTVEDDEDTISKVETFDDLLRHYNIRDNLLKTDYYNNEFFPTNLVKNYFRYRRIDHGKLDHGILGGMYLYHKLLKIREEKFNRRENDLYWGEDLITQYAQACYAIAVHNIWIPKKENYPLYLKYDLNSLVENYKPISLDEFPLLFILGIVDTIDPIKIFQEVNLKPSEIMNNVMFEFHQNQISISVKENIPIDFEKLISNAKNLDGWLDVSVSTYKKRIEIIFSS